METLTGYLAPEGLEHELRDELALAGVRPRLRHDRLVISSDPPVAAAWSANIWHDVETIPITSIGHAAKELKERQRNWAVYAPVHGGRAGLIADKLPYVSAKPLQIGAPAPAAALGSWTLVEPDLMLVSTRCDSPFPNGVARLVEDRVGPPSRAYLKLWEAFVRIGVWPSETERCLDLGASPGGWTWLLAQTGATVHAVDKAPLEASVDRLANVEWIEGSAFGLDPKSFDGVDWLLSDIICYPRRLLGLVERWLDAGVVRNLVCTIKFQGATDHEIIGEFRRLPGAKVFHLHHNKHELTLAIIRPV